MGLKAPARKFGSRENLFSRKTKISPTSGEKFPASGEHSQRSRDLPKPHVRTGNAMSKRSRNDNSLTGGTGDVNPQYFTMEVSQTTANNTLSKAFPIPIQRLQQNSGRAQVMEVLKVFFDTGFTNNGADYGLEAAISTRDHGTTRVTFAGPDVFAFLGISVDWNAAGNECCC